VNAPITLVVAVAENGVIGNKGALPWRIPEDLKRFKALTIGKPCIMGRKTWDSLPKKPLPGRTNIVVTRFPNNYRADGVKAAHDVNGALDIARRENPPEIMIIGGATIFKAVLPRADCIELTEIQGDFAGDTRMPQFDRTKWEETQRKGPYRTDEGIVYSFVTLKRKFRTE
jgi:dihydrofolate reductase